MIETFNLKSLHQPGPPIRSKKLRIESKFSFFDLILQYWKLLALDVGSYSSSDINAGGKEGEEIKQKIKEDFARSLKRYVFIVLTRLNFRVEIYYQTLNVQSITQSAKYTVRFKNYFITTFFIY